MTSRGQHLSEYAILVGVVSLVATSMLPMGRSVVGTVIRHLSNATYGPAPREDDPAEITWFYLAGEKTIESGGGLLGLSRRTTFEGTLPNPSVGFQPGGTCEEWLGPDGQGTGIVASKGCAQGTIHTELGRIGAAPQPAQPGGSGNQRLRKTR